MSSCSMELITCMELAVKFPVDGSFKHFASTKLLYSGKFSEGEIFGNFGKNQ